MMLETTNDMPAKAVKIMVMVEIKPEIVDENTSAISV
jgi:hypothetical protein